MLDFLLQAAANTAQHAGHDDGDIIDLLAKLLLGLLVLVGTVVGALVVIAKRGKKNGGNGNGNGKARTKHTKHIAREETNRIDASLSEIHQTLERHSGLFADLARSFGSLKDMWEHTHEQKEQLGKATDMLTAITEVINREDDEGRKRIYTSIAAERAQEGIVTALNSVANQLTEIIRELRN